MSLNFAKVLNFGKVIFSTKIKPMIKFSALYLVMIFLFSCAYHKEKKNNDDPSKNDTMVSNSNDYLRFTGDSIEMPPFEIELSLSAKAEEKLKTIKETIIVAAYFSGIPKDTTLKEYVKYGEIAIGSREKELTGERVAKFEGIKFPKTLLDTIAAKNMSLLINVYSGRKSTKDNLLDCDILQKPISEIKGNKFVLKGKLIGE